MNKFTIEQFSSDKSDYDSDSDESKSDKDQEGEDEYEDSNNNYVEFAGNSPLSSLLLLVRLPPFVVGQLLHQLCVDALQQSQGMISRQDL